jgi:hypothetical protein
MHENTEVKWKHLSEAMSKALETGLNFGLGP